MRVTQRMMDRSMLDDVNRSLERLSESQRRMASQKKIERPSDSPGDLQALLAVKEQLRVSERYRKNIDSALLVLNRTDSGLNNIADQLMRAKEDAVRSSGSLSPSARTALADDLESTIRGVLDELNSKFGGEYLYAGTASGSQPFAETRGADPDGTRRLQTVLYSGNSANTDCDISENSAIAAGCSGEAVAAPGAGGLFETLIALRRAIVSGTDTTLVQADLDANLARLDGLQVRLGANINYLAGVLDRIGDNALNMEEQRSSIEDTDFTEETLEQGRRQAEYQAVLAATAKRSQLSLINYL